MSDREFGQTRFLFVGSRADDQVSLAITPLESPEGVTSSAGTVRGRLQPDGSLAGVWETELGTAGKFTATRRGASMEPKSSEKTGTEQPSRKSAITPLRVISVFLSLCEVVAGLAVTQASGGVQVTLTVFVVSFPVLVAAAFFAILWKKPYVFYPPTEFGGATNVSEYVRALGGLSPTESAERQLALIGGSAKTAPVAAEPPSSVAGAENGVQDDLVPAVLKYFAFKRMRYSDVSNPDTRAVFNIGAFQGFNLFDGVPGITFFGHFPDLDAVEIVVRIRFLLNNIELAQRRVAEQAEASQRDAAVRILDQLSVEVLVGDDGPIEQIQNKIEEYRPEGVHVSVEVRTPSEIKRIVQAEYASIGL